VSLLQTVLLFESGGGDRTLRKRLHPQAVASRQQGLALLFRPRQMEKLLTPLQLGGGLNNQQRRRLHKRLRVAMIRPLPPQCWQRLGVHNEVE